MKKNVASQKIGAQLISASDGSAFTGAVTVYVTGDAGTQAVGSVGSGACTHEGNGYHTYAPAQAETNYDLIAFTFIGTGAIPVTVQIFTSFPQTGDSYVEVTNGTYGLSAIETLVDGVESTLATLPTNASIADAVWDEATVGHTTAGTFGEQVKTDIDACKILVIGWDSKDQENLGGEYKRHQVYSKLIKLYPQHDRKKLALLIELVINELV